MFLAMCGLVGIALLLCASLWASLRVVTALVTALGDGAKRAAGGLARLVGGASAASAPSWSVEGALTEGELRLLGALAAEHPRIGRALALRSRILGAVGRREPGPSGARVDGIVRLLGQHEARIEEIAEAMAAGPAEGAQRTRYELRGRLAECASPDEQRSLRERIAALEARERNLARLAQRRGLLSSDAERCLVALENLWMTALDAPVEGAGAPTSQLAAALDELDERSRSLRDQTEADEEVAQLLRPDFAARRAGARR
jgi:hypothetical protein